MLEPRIMPASYAIFFMFMLVHILALPCGLIFGHLRQFSSIMLAIWRYFDISAKPPQIGATSIFFPIVMLHIAFYASIIPQFNLALLPPAYAASHASKGHSC